VRGYGATLAQRGGAPRATMILAGAADLVRREGAVEQFPVGRLGDEFSPRAPTSGYGTSPHVSRVSSGPVNL
jgi:hypothetical protein